MMRKVYSYIISLLIFHAFILGFIDTAQSNPLTEILENYNVSTDASTASAASTVSAANENELLLKRTEKTDTSQNPELVKKLQRSLQALGYYLGYPIDGWFGPHTQMAVMEVQRKYGYWISGVVDQGLFDAIEEKASVKKAAAEETSATAQTNVASVSSRVVVDNAWVNLKNIDYAKQQTGYTCGPASLKMALSIYGINISESWTASAASTARTGTTHSGLFNAVAKVNAKFNTNISTGHQTFKSMGWSNLENHLKTGNPVIIHLKSWYGSWTHYAVLAGINMEKKQVRLADPSGGWRTVSFAEMERRMAYHSEPSVITIKKT